MTYKFDLTSAVLCFALLPAALCAQEEDTWYAFYDEKNELTGFKDNQGQVRIEPKFMGFTAARRFRNIMAVMEQEGDNFVSYYLLKNGKRIGVGNTFVRDMRFDCEREGSIRFRDQAKDKVGFFDAQGNVIVAASYNYASPFRNGLAIVGQQARRICWDSGEQYSEQNRCEHWGWRGGRQFLIDKDNNRLVDDFDLDMHLDWYSMTIAAVASPDPRWVSMRGNNGRFYNFIDLEKDFRQWLLKRLLPGFNRAKMIEHSFEQVSYWLEPQGWLFKKRREFMRQNFALLRSRLSMIANSGVTYAIFVEGLNGAIFEQPQYEQFFDDCGQADMTRYPVFNLVVDHTQAGKRYQDHFDFLKTEKGYRLISVTIRPGGLQ